jgi:hypothetical protein
MYIVELEPGVWLAKGKGDPPRTILREKAREWKRWEGAANARHAARKHRPFDNARIVEV